MVGGSREGGLIGALEGDPPAAECSNNSVGHQAHTQKVSKVDLVFQSSIEQCKRVQYLGLKQEKRLDG